MTDRERLIHYCELAGRLLGASESLAASADQYVRECHLRGWVSTETVARGSLARWQEAVRAWEKRDEDGSVVSRARRALGSCPRCGLQPVGIQGMVCFECHQAQERSDRD